MHIYLDQKTSAYDGGQLKSLWAYRHYQLMGDSIIVFRGPCNVNKEALVDVQDQLANNFIYSPDMLHFIAEHFGCDLEKAVLRQRLMITQVEGLLREKSRVCLVRRGDDLYAGERKLSVSIATVSPVSSLIHLGLNIDASGAPVPAVGLKEIGLSDDSLWEFAHTVCANYQQEVQDIKLACCKVRGVD